MYVTFVRPEKTPKSCVRRFIAQQITFSTVNNNVENTDSNIRYCSCRAFCNISQRILSVLRL